VEGMQRVAAKLAAIEEHLQGSVLVRQERSANNETGLRQRRKTNSDSPEEAANLSNASPPKGRQHHSDSSELEEYIRQCNPAKAPKTKSRKGASTSSGRAFSPVLLWRWAPALTERQQCLFEYVQPLVLPLIAQKLRFSSTGSSHCWAIVLFHTIECIFTDWGPNTEGWHVKNAPISTEVHSWIDSLFIIGGLVAGMLIAPDQYGGPSQNTFWTAIVLLCMQPFYLAMSYSSAAYNMQKQEARARQGWTPLGKEEIWRLSCLFAI